MFQIRIELFLILALFFGSVAGIMAFLITFEEYKKHYPGGKLPLRIALQTGLVAFLLFAGLTAALGLILYRKAL